MDYLKIKRNLENYTVRNIPKRLITVNASGDTVVNTSSPNYYYGQIPEYKIDKEGFFILDSAGKKIPNTIDINIFITRLYVSMNRTRYFLPINRTRFFLSTRPRFLLSR